MLITLEGLPGSGKTTQTTLLADCLRRAGHEVATLPDLATLETEPVTTSIVNILASAGDPYLRSGDAVTDTLLSAAIRADIVATILGPILKAGPETVVIEDRGIHTMASYALASLRRHHRIASRDALDWLAALTALAGPCPSQAYWLKVAPPTAFARVTRRGNSPPTPAHQAYLRAVDDAYAVLVAHDSKLTTIHTEGLAAAEVHYVLHKTINTILSPVGSTAECSAGLPDMIAVPS